MVFALLGVVIAFGALIVAGQALNRSDAKDVAAGATAPSVGLTEFSIDPGTIDVEAGGSLSVKNSGSVVHNLAVKSTDVTTPDLAPGAGERLDLSGLKDGMHTAYCAIAGHEAAGMSAVLHVGLGGGAAGSVAAEQISPKENDRLDALQKAPVDVYVARLESGANTEGVGALLLEPTVLADGTKQFELTTEVVDWDVEPGKMVKAWTYNGMVPGPTIKVPPGDRVRVVLDNQLPRSTSIHWHGISTPNDMDGVPYITQEPVKPGDTFVYEFVAECPAVGTYHSHHHAQHQVPACSAWSPRSWCSSDDGRRSVPEWRLARTVPVSRARRGTG